MNALSLRSLKLYPVMLVFGLSAAWMPAAQSAYYTVTLTDSGINYSDDPNPAAYPIPAGAKEPGEAGLTPILHVSSPGPQCNKLLGMVNPAIAIPYNGQVRRLRAYFNGKALPLVKDPVAYGMEEAHSYGTMIGFFKPLFSLAAIPAGTGALNIRGYNSDHQLLKSITIPNLTIYKPPAPVSFNSIAALPHPRIWLTPARLAKVKARPASDPFATHFYKGFTGNGTSFHGLDDFLDTLKQIPDPESPAFNDVIWNPESYTPMLAACWQIFKASDAAKAQECARAAKIMALRIANDYNAGIRDFGRDTGYDIRDAFPQMLLAYDWMHDALSDEERALILKVANAWVEWYSTSDGAYSRNLPRNNYYPAFLQAMMMAAIATAGENVSAEGFLKQLRTKLATEMPMNNQRLCGGDWAEGWNYGPESVRAFALVDRALKDIGEDWGAVFDFYQPLARSFTYQMSPDFSELRSFGGYSGSVPHKTSPSLLAVLSANSADAAFASRLYNQANRRANNDFFDGTGGDTVYEIIFGDNTQKVDLNALPLSYLNPGTGRFFSHSSLASTSAYQVTMENMNFAYDHFGYANGDVRLYKGGRCLLCPAAYRGGSFRGEDSTGAFSTYQLIVRGQPVDQNVRLADGSPNFNNYNNQVLYTQEAGAFSAIGVRFESSFTPDRFDESVVHSGNPLDYLIREAVHIRPGTLVVRDLHRRRHLRDGLRASWHFGSSETVTPLAANQYQLGQLKISFAGNSTPAPVFAPDYEGDNIRIGTFATQTFPASIGKTEQIAVFSETDTVVSYAKGVLKLSGGQCVNFTMGGVRVGPC